MSNYLNVPLPEEQQASTRSDVYHKAFSGAKTGANIGGTVGSIAATAFGLPPQLGQIAGNVAGGVIGGEIGFLVGQNNRYKKDARNEMSIQDRTNQYYADANYSGVENGQVKKLGYSGNVIAKRGMPDIKGNKIIEVEKDEIVFRTNPDNPNEVQMVADYVNGKNHSSGGEIYITQEGDTIFPAKMRKEALKLVNNKGYVIDVPKFEALKNKLPKDSVSTIKYKFGVESVMPLAETLMANEDLSTTLSSVFSDKLGSTGGTLNVRKFLGNLLNSRMTKEEKANIPKYTDGVGSITINRGLKSNKFSTTSPLDNRQKYRYDYFQKYGKYPEDEMPVSKFFKPAFNRGSKELFGSEATFQGDNAFGNITRANPIDTLPFGSGQLSAVPQANITPFSFSETSNAGGFSSKLDKSTVKNITGLLNSTLQGLSQASAKPEVKQPTRVNLGRLSYFDNSDRTRSRLGDLYRQQQQGMVNASGGNSSMVLANLQNSYSAQMGQLREVDNSEKERMSNVATQNVTIGNREAELNAAYYDQNVTANEGNRAAVKMTKQQGANTITGGFNQYMQNSNVADKDAALKAENDRQFGLKTTAEQNANKMQKNTFALMFLSNPQVAAQFRNNESLRNMLTTFGFSTDEVSTYLGKADGNYTTSSSTNNSPFYYKRKQYGN